MEKRSSFSGSIGFVLAAAGSAVGLGNIWRFPYLAAKDGGGLFLVIYIILALTFGFTLLVTEVSIGRKTKQSCLTAYGKLHKKWGWLGGLASIVPFIIMPYYCVIGGWVLKYALVFITGQGGAAASDDFFTQFITGYAEPIVYNFVFLLMTAIVIFRGVNKGIEALSKVLMPILFVLIIGIAIYSLTLTGSEESGGRTGIQGLSIYLIPNFDGVGVRDVLMTVMDAMGQLFYSISVAMGIMVTYGSYFKNEDNLLRSVNQIEIFDTGVALLAGMAIIPSIYVFSGLDGMNAGPGLMFISLPKVFASMGFFGNIVGAAFFLMAVFATLTSCISVLEAITANCMEVFHSERHKTTLVLGIIYTIASIVIALGYSIFYCEIPLPNGTVGQLLDLMDYISNSVMMPFISLLSTILIGWIVRPKWIIGEVETGGVRFHRKQLYIVMVRLVCPVIMVVLFLQSTGLLSKL